MKYIVISLIAYLLGSFCSSIPISKQRFGEDVRSNGSGNAGATNMARCFGVRAGVTALVCDMLKTIAAMFIGKYMAGDTGAALAGAFCIIGHCFPLFFGFRGGKGVSVGAALALMQGMTVFIITILVFGVVAVLSRKVSLASLSASVALPIASLVFCKSTPMLIMSIFSAILVIFMHRENVKRLLNGTEADFKPGKI